jgi:hypothetical protein
MHYLSISGIFKWENPWLKEWLDYHLKVGIEHFYLYNNDDDPTESDRILKPYVDQGLVDNIHAPGPVMLVPCMQEAIRHFSTQTHWMAFTDLDEFILPRRCDDIREVLQDYDLYSGLAVHWTIFGSNGHITRPPNQIDYFLRRAEEAHPCNRHIKSIVRPSLVAPETVNHPHYMGYRSGHAVNEGYRSVDSPFDDYSGDILRLNHYIVRSFQDTKEIKIPRRRADCSLEINENYFENFNCNEVYDDEISRRFGSSILVREE